MEEKKLTFRQNGWVGTEDKKTAFKIEKEYTSISVCNAWDDKYQTVGLTNDIILELAEEIKKVRGEEE